METHTYLSSSSSSAILSKCRWSLCPSLASINQWQLRLFPLLWLLTDGGGDSIRPTVALRIHPPQDTAKEKNTYKSVRSVQHCFCIKYKSKRAYWPTHCGSGVLQRGCVVLVHVATSWPRTWKPASQWKCAWPPGWMSVTVTPPPSGDRGNGQDSRKAEGFHETDMLVFYGRSTELIAFKTVMYIHFWSFSFTSHFYFY